MDSYNRLLEDLAGKYGMTAEQLDKKVIRRRAQVFGLLSKGMTARVITGPAALTSFLGSGARHISGLHVSDALAAARKEALAGNISTFGYWPKPGELPESIAKNYVAAVDAIADAGIVSSVSIKVDRLDYDWDILYPVLHRAMERRVRIHFDAQGKVDPTHDLIEKSCALGADVSGTLQSRLMRSLDDVERFVKLQIPIRVVKGQDADPQYPKLDPRRSYMALVERLAGRAAHIGVATHDRRTAEPALDALMEAKTPCSLEQLRSLPRLDFLAEKRGVPVRAYVAYGHFGLPYAVNEIFRRPSIVWWILRDAVERLR
jgi:proline dehydrogenase